MKERQKLYLKLQLSSFDSTGKINIPNVAMTKYLYRK